jgi:hypothetical protein
MMKLENLKYTFVNKIKIAFKTDIPSWILGKAENFYFFLPTG